MARVTHREELEVQLDRIISRIDADARDNGHDPHPWKHDNDGPGLAASTACRKCGRTAAARVRDGHGPWSAGHMRFATCD